MTAELKKRIVTSIFLLIISMLIISINKIVFIVAILSIGTICLYEFFNFNKKRKKSHFERFLLYFLSITYFFVFIYSSILLRADSISGINFFIITLFICIFSDIGGYITGKAIGGKKLTHISPNKTISGSIGSFVFSVFPLFIYIMIRSFENFYIFDNHIRYYFTFNFIFSFKNIFFCLLVSLVCQAGDLFISYFKRLNKVKDTGNILPGHGGLLDRIDGIIFAIPFVYFLKITQLF